MAFHRSVSLPGSRLQSSYIADSSSECPFVSPPRVLTNGGGGNELQTSWGDRYTSPLARRDRAASVIQRAFRKRREVKAVIGLADDLMGQGNLQAADWTYRKAGAYTSAAAVRNEIESILETEPILEEKAIEEGMTRLATRKVRLRDRVSGLIKFGHLWPANWRHEVAAYKLDQLLGLNVVPVTVPRSAHRSSMGFFENAGWGALNLLGKVFGSGVTYSMQYFIEDASTAYEHPDMPRPDNQMRFLDFLIDNRDRHGKNFLVSTARNNSKSQIAIDHGLAFPSGSGVPFLWDIEGAIPSQRVFERLKYMSPRRFKRMLSPWLTRSERKGVWDRRLYLIERIEEHNKTHGVPAKWRRGV